MMQVEEQFAQRFVARANRLGGTTQVEGRHAGPAWRPLFIVPLLFQEQNMC